MKKNALLLLLLTALLVVASSVQASAGVPYRTGGVSVCPNPGAPDADGDGIPNGLDTDYVPPRDGTGRHLGCLASMRGLGPFVTGFQYRFSMMLDALGITGGFGPGDGTGNGGDGPADGTGYGPGGFGDGTCDGDGPRDMRYHYGRK